jgi:hypothetical protein
MRALPDVIDHQQAVSVIQLFGEFSTSYAHVDEVRSLSMLRIVCPV